MAKSRTPAYEDISPYVLLRELPALASNVIPPCLKTYCQRSGLKPWELLEEGVFYFFRQILMLDTLRLGSQTLFQHEPEGIVLVNRDPKPFALMYECKARSNPYAMSSDDVLRYKDYIRTQRHRIKEREHLDLTHFTIVSSGFSGDVDERLRDLESEGVVISMMPAMQLQRASTYIRELDFYRIQLFDLRRFFARGVAGDAAVEERLSSSTRA